MLVGAGGRDPEALAACVGGQCTCLPTACEADGLVRSLTASKVTALVCAGLGLRLNFPHAQEKLVRTVR